MIRELLRLHIHDEEDLFAFRQAGREAADAVGLDGPDRARVAAAISELGREAYAEHGPVEAVFWIRRVQRPALVVEVGFRREERPALAEAMAVAARLMDEVEEETRGDRVIVRVRKHLPEDAPVPGDARVRAVQERLARLVPASAQEELRRQNEELIEALEDLRRKHEELRELHAELEETNHGVVAMYNQLTQEMEETNQGVVALYAELDDKSEQLRRASESKNRFWANISHELRTPINSMIGLARLLLDTRADPLSAEQRHQIGLIAHSGQTILALVDELLDMAKAEEGRLSLRPVPVDVPALLEHLRSLLEPMAEQAGLRLVVEGATGPSDAPVTDEVMLTRILRNLLANGLKFTRRGEVRLAARTEDGHVVFTVADTGVGIAPEEQERVFEEFYQVPGSGGGGTGLGLPYARRLAEALGGGLTLHSALGEGTTVTVRIPLSPGGEPGPRRPPGAGRAGTADGTGQEGTP
ncbi:Signal transduction histidine kinase [Thermomonospora echinospora]|uniref:histidine kinase n=1 Tax=Thermomonospora echinospora TaxID=1992 RepID=A0A1H6BWH2_9ACTN|nr:ATP-binding protein [Thermomonospora echinospora]SEG65030.1 Signal transduction histidine kinase [Thermomonospora echinospora]